MVVHDLGQADTPLALPQCPWRGILAGTTSNHTDVSSPALSTTLGQSQGQRVGFQISLKKHNVTLHTCAPWKHASLGEVWLRKFNMESFGCASRKPTHLISNRQWVLDLEPGPHRAQGVSQNTRKYWDKQGKRRCTGTKWLKSTQCDPQTSSRSIGCTCVDAFLVGLILGEQVCEVLKTDM